jgi:hypothetical protein
MLCEHLAELEQALVNSFLRYLFRGDILASVEFGGATQ